MNGRERLGRNYRTAFLRFLPRRDEAALADGYEIGRSAAGEALTILDLVHVHHDVLDEVVGTTGPDERPAVLAAAADFLGEVLATYEITRRAYVEKG